jgi:hypothetical protein
VAAVEAVLKKGDAAAATARLEAEMRRHGESPRWASLKERIADLEQRERAKAVAALLKEAKSLSGAGKYKEALVKLEAASSIAPSDQAVAEAFDQVTTAQRRKAEEAEQRRQEETEAEQRRQAEAAEQRRLAEAAEQRRQAEAAEERRKAEAAQQRRKAEEAEQRRLAEEAEQRRQAQAAEVQRRAEGAARIAEQEATHKQQAIPAEPTLDEGTRRITLREVAPRPVEPVPVPPRPEPEKPPKPRPPITPPRPEVRPAVKPEVKPAVKPEVKPAVKPEPKPEARPEPEKPKGKPLGLWIGVAAAVLLVAVLGFLLSRKPTPGPQPTPVPTEAVATPLPARTPEPGATPPPVTAQVGGLVVNAFPWGQVTAIVDGQGRAFSLPAETRTPLLLSLPAGRYTITLTNPEVPGSATLTAEVTAGGVARVQDDRRKGDPDEFLKQLGW